jgi:hypothetical protein
MDLLTQADLRQLSETEGEWCVSIYLPTVRAGTEAQQNPIRLKNLLREAAEQLKGVGVRVPDVATILEPVQALLDDADFWRNVGDGLVIFVGPDMLRMFRLPATFEELVVVRHRFHIKPLLVLLSGDGRFFVLALSQDEIRVLEGTRDSVHEVHVDGVPTSMAEALQYDDPQQMKRATATGRGAVFGGGDAADASGKQDILRYFQMVDRGLREVLAEQTIPLVLAGVDYLLPIYHEANTYPHLLEYGVTGNPETWSTKELHRRAWDVVKPHFEQAQSEQRALYAELAGRDEGRADNRVVDVVRAAVEGRIATLFVAKDVQKWGVYRAHSHKVHAHPTRQPGDQDLLDVAAVQTFLGGGTVYVVEQANVPGGDVLAAVFRY